MLLNRACEFVEPKGKPENPGNKRQAEDGFRPAETKEYSVRKSNRSTGNPVDLHAIGIPPSNTKRLLSPLFDRCRRQPEGRRR
jgi:hypothetical protein